MGYRARARGVEGLSPNRTTVFVGRPGFGATNMQEAELTVHTLSPRLELGLVHRYSVEPQVWLVDGAHDGQVKLAAETESVERIRGLDHQDAEVSVEPERSGVGDQRSGVGASHFAR